MTTITKEQVHAVSDLKAGYTLGHANVAILQRLARIALASLEAEPVYQFIYNNPYEEGYTEWLDCNKDYFNGVPEDCRRILYTAPPAPVSDSLISELLAIAKKAAEEADECAHAEWNDDSMEHSAAISDWERRAAMLQGADGNSPVIPDCWVACSERMPDIGTEIFYFCQDDGLRDCGIVSSSNFSNKGDAELYVHSEGYDLRFGVDITHWMPLPAAPQQEDFF
ncbi:DUF551 domain-containing protein [Enterobacter ludwigii]